MILGQKLRYTKHSCFLCLWDGRARNSHYQWKSVLWIDESKFELFGSHRRQNVRRKVNERFKPDRIVPTVKHGGGSVMVGGCFSHAGVGQLKKIAGIMKKEQYHSILQRHAIPCGINLIGWETYIKTLYFLFGTKKSRR